MQERQWITARRSELDALADELAKQLQEVQAERDELAITERVLNRGRGVGPGRQAHRRQQDRHHQPGPADYAHLEKVIQDGRSLYTRPAGSDELERLFFV